ncbi:hypothetical protein [Microbacterium gorillae]|uniref:hypothetical protein n=1 Tax=Microbacterium gorillae TaxID=1231063 RepID=UPI000591229D|nr:hypothetical protein [Microbacterium gorillae]
MTTTEHNEPQLTRRQLRELRLTGQTPVVQTADTPVPAENAEPTPPRRDAPEPAATATETAQETAEPAAPLPRAVETEVPSAPEVPQADESAPEDHPLTRREARELERARTASLAVSEEVSTPAEDREPTPPPARDSAEPASAWAPPAAPVEDAEAEAEAAAVVEEAPSEPVASAPSTGDEWWRTAPATGAIQIHRAATAEEPTAPNADAASGDEWWRTAPATGAIQIHRAAAEEVRAPEPAPVRETAHVVAAPTTDDDGVSEGKPTVNADFGAEVLAEATATVPPAGTTSFDDLLTRDSASSGSTASGSTLILNDSAMPLLTAPVTSSGERLVTGTFNLPDSFGSQGHSPGTTDGKDVDAVLIDGELPPASSPTPIAATAAVSQAKAPGEIIKAPAPEKSNKLMLVLAITAGALALALGGVIVVALLNGAFQ